MAKKNVTPTRGAHSVGFLRNMGSWLGNTFAGKFIVKNSLWLEPFTYLLIFADIFILQTYKDSYFVLGIAAWILATSLQKLGSKRTFTVALVMFFGMFISYIATSGSSQTERLATWLYFFVWIGGVQLWNESRT